jgi:hypothetical protein
MNCFEARTDKASRKVLLRSGTFTSYSEHQQPTGQLQNLLGGMADPGQDAAFSGAPRVLFEVLFLSPYTEQSRPIRHFVFISAAAEPGFRCHGFDIDESRHYPDCLTSKPLNAASR